MKQILTAFLFLCSIPLFAQNFQAISPEIARSYHFDLAKNFYRDEAAFEKDLAEAKQVAETLQKYKGNVVSSGKGLLEIATLLERLNLLTAKLYVYRFLAYSTNTKLEPQFSATDQNVSQLNAKTAFVATELRGISNEQLETLIKEEPLLKSYRFFLEQNTRYKPHTLSSDQEELFGLLSPDLYSWEPQFFQKLIDRTKFSKIQTPAGVYDVYRERQVLNKDPDRNIRKEAMLKLYDEYSASGDLMGFIFLKQAKALNNAANVRNFKDAFDASLFGAYLSKDQANSFFEAIGDFAPLMQRYIQIRKARIKAISGIDPVEPWDMEVIPKDYKRPQFTIQQTTDILNAALAFHGPEYSKDLSALLNPQNGRLDIVKGENRTPGAFAWGVYGSPFVFYSFGYLGYTDDLLTLAHEAGHVVHYDLIAANKVPFVYADGPSYFTEGFAMLNEFVTLDYLYNQSTNKEDKIFYLEQWLTVAMRRFFDIVMRSEFEYRAYEKILSGELTEADQLHALWKSEGLKYIGDDYNRNDFMKYGWSFTPHYFSSPRYYINYLFANLMAISFYQKHTEDPKFSEEYLALMVNGFPDTPVNLLKKHMDLDPFSPATVQDSMNVFEQKLAQLEQLYR